MKHLCCVKILFCVLIWIASTFVITHEKDLQIIKFIWEICCEKNFCKQNSCYLRTRRKSYWSTTRQRCQSMYSDFPGYVDMFTVEEPEDAAEILYKLILKEKHSIGSIKVWSGGTRCPIATPDGTTLLMRWVSGKKFPGWLSNRLSVPEEYKKAEVKEGCKYLVVNLSENSSLISYEFQRQTEHHSSICEFKLPDEIPLTTFPNSINESEKTFETEKHHETTVEIIHKKSVTLAPAEGYKIPDFDQTKSTKETALTTELDLTPTVSTAFCKARKTFGILWPDTAPGATVNISCPEGMTGYAQWKCSGITLNFVPDIPHVQDCKHVWISKLEDDVNKQGNAVAISHKLADQTNQQKMSHGDITALVELSAKLYNLYQVQVNEDNLIEEVIKEEEKILPYAFTGSMVSSMSNILKVDVKNAWEILPKVHQTRTASKILQLVTSIGSHLSCIKSPTSNNALQFTVSKENIDLQTFILDEMELSNTSLVFPEVLPGEQTNSSIILPPNLNIENWYSPCQKHNSAVGVIYKNVGDFLKNDNLTISPLQVASKVISFTLGNNSQSIFLKGQDVTIVMKHTIEGINDKLNKLHCMFWNFSRQEYGQWDESGCYLVTSNETHTICACNHLTNFAVLMDVNEYMEEDSTLSILTYVCCGLSSISLIITLICFIAIRSLHGRRTIITSNLCICLLITNMLVLFGLDKTSDRVICSIIAGLLHFWILSAFFWMLVEGYQLYKMVILVFQRGTNLSIKYYYVFAYGVPIIIVSIAAGIKSNDYIRKNYCWLSSNLTWSFIAPACAIILVNLIIFIMTLKSASSVRIKREQSTLTKIKSWARGSMSVMCLLGLTWCLGLFHIEKKMFVFSYIFTVLNGLQGFFIFIFHIILNDKTSTCFLNLKKNNQDFWIKITRPSSRNKLHSSTSNRTSTLSSGFTSSSTQRSTSRIMSNVVSTTTNNNQSKNDIKSARKKLTNLNVKNPIVKYKEAD